MRNNYGLRMRQECRESFIRHRFKKRPLVSQAIRHASRFVCRTRAVMYVQIANPWWRGKRSQHSRHMRNRQFCWRPMVLPKHTFVISVSGLFACNWQCKWLRSISLAAVRYILCHFTSIGLNVCSANGAIRNITHRQNEMNRCITALCLKPLLSGRKYIWALYCF